MGGAQRHPFPLLAELGGLRMSNIDLSGTGKHQDTFEQKVTKITKNYHR
jgi:hypothetical protein